MVSSFFSGRFYGNNPQHSIGISEKSRANIVAAARRLNYLPDNPVLRLRLYPESGDYCFLLNADVSEGIANPYFSRMVNGVLAELNDPSRQISYGQFQTTVDYLADTDLLPNSLRTATASRFILAGAPNYSLITAIVQRGGLCVYLSRVVPLSGVSSVVPDYAEAAKLAVRHLVDRGHRKISFGAEYYFLPADAYNKQELVRGCAEAMKEAGLAFSAEDVVYKTKAALSPPNEILERILKRKPRPTAVFCFDDFTALGLMRAAMEAGLRLPQDLSVIGCNDENRMVGLRPTLSTVHLPAEEMGAMAVRELARMLKEDPAKPSAAKCMLPVQLVERESVLRLN